jgi:MarR family transcriptional regulator for hemolysin
MAINTTRLLQFYQHFGNFYTQQFAPLTEESGLSVRELHILLFLANNPGYDTARDTTVLRGISKSQVSQAVDLLWAEGLLDRTQDTADRRIVHLSITEEGWDITRKALTVQDSCAARLLSGFSQQEIALLMNLVDRVIDNAEVLAGEEP